jgi:hypothetical protein
MFLRNTGKLLLDYTVNTPGAIALHSHRRETLKPKICLLLVRVLSFCTYLYIVILIIIIVNLGILSYSL